MNRGLSLLLLVCLASCERKAPPPPPSPIAIASSAPSAAPAPSASAAAPTKIVFEPVIGDWSEETDGFAVDGTKWRDGTPSANLADQAKKLYGDRYAEFLDGVKAYAFFPLAVADQEVTGDARLSVRFHPIAGKIDQAAGIAFAIAPDGSYLGVRANALEDNVLFFKVVKGKRTVLETIRNVPTPTKTWHTLVVELRGTKLQAFVDDTKRVDRTLDAKPVGRVGLWSKADSHVVFADFKIEKL